MANAYANAVVFNKIENLVATFCHRKSTKTSSRFLPVNTKENDKSYQNPVSLAHFGRIKLVLPKKPLKNLYINRGKKKHNKTITWLGRYVATEHTHCSVATHMARSLRSDRAHTLLGRYVATEHAHCSVAKQPSTHTARSLRSDRAQANSPLATPPCGELRGLIQLALWRPGSPLELLSPVSIVQLFISSRSDFPLRFYDENKSARRIETVRISSPCGELRGLFQLALWRPGSPLELLSPVSIVQLFVSSRSDFPLRFYDENKSARRIETVRTSSPCGELRGLIQLALWQPGSPFELLSPVSIQLFVSSQLEFPLRFYDENKSARRIETVRISSPCGELRELTQLAQWRAGPLLELLSQVSIAQIFVSSRFYDKNRKDLFFV
ncbi:hypothetical protein F2Q68_00010867 [Brassica cretica]|uniref:Uncharacterized protein n=1 Tax=Brassica cretica TaxID=69181 RepID=A0A8S9KNH1_BRACR|nr:hypothetical protein F2Q68_00010867 [Brassica cretica]